MVYNSAASHTAEPRSGNGSARNGSGHYESSSGQRADSTKRHRHGGNPHNTGNGSSENPSVSPEQRPQLKLEQTVTIVNYDTNESRARTIESGLAGYLNQCDELAGRPKYNFRVLTTDNQLINYITNEERGPTVYLVTFNGKDDLETALSVIYDQRKTGNKMPIVKVLAHRKNQVAIQEVAKELQVNPGMQLIMTKHHEVGENTVMFLYSSLQSTFKTLAERYR